MGSREAMRWPGGADARTEHRPDAGAPLGTVRQTIRGRVRPLVPLMPLMPFLRQGYARALCLALVGLVLGLGAGPSHAAVPNKTLGGEYYAEVPAVPTPDPYCAGCHGLSPDPTNATGIFNAANNPGQILTAASCPGGITYAGVNSCTQMNDGGGPIQSTIGPGATNGAANRADIAYYIADFVPPVVTNGAVTTAFRTAITIDLSNYISGYNSAGNLTFAGGNATSVTVTGGPTNGGTVAPPVGLTVRYTPPANLCSTTDTFTFTATGPGGTSATSGTITITINAFPAPKTAATTVNGVPYQATGYAISLAAAVAAANPGLPACIVTGLLTPTTGTATANGGTITGVTPPYGLTYSAPIDKLTDTFTYSVYGPGGNSTASTVSVNIATPAPPGLTVPAVTLTAEFNPGAPTPNSSVLTVTSAFNVTAPNGPINSYGTPVEVAGPNNGTVVAGPGVGQVTYTPKPLYIGNDQFTIAATNPGGSATATITVAVQAPAPPTRLTTPIASTATYNNGPPATADTIDLSAGVFGGYVVGLQVGGATLPTTTPHGTVSQGSGPEILLYTPAQGFHGVDTFTVTAYNTSGSSPPVTINATTNLPGPPVAHNLAVAGTVPYGTATPIDLTASITGVLNNTNPVTVTQPTHGSVTVAGKVVTYTSASTFYGGADSFTYTASGPGGNSAAATVSLVVAPPVAPSAGSKPVSVIFDTPTAINLQPLVTGISNSVAIATPPGHGTVSTSGYSVTYTPNNGYLGPDSFTYTATGPGGTSTPGTLSITVSALPTSAPPVTLSVPLNTPTTVNLASVITGSGITGVAILTQPAHGTVIVSGTSITYTPGTNYFGPDSFTYRAFGAGGNSSGTVTIQIIGRPDPSKDPDVTGLIDAQIAEARVFTRTQISNFQQRMDSLHTAPAAASGAAGASAAGPGTNGVQGLAATRAAQAQAAAQAGSAGDAPSAPLASGSTSNVPALLAAAAHGGASTDPFADGPATAAPSPLDTANGQYRLSPTALAASSLQSGSVVGPVDPSSRPGTSLAAFPVNLTSLDLASVAGAVGSAGDARSGVGVWVTGAVNFGNREQPQGLSNGLKFHTDGVSLGADRRFADNLVAGIGLGYAYDRTAVGTDGTQSKSSGTVVAAYASYQPTPQTYVDAVIGAGSLDFDSERFVAAADQTASGHRTGQQVFASVTAGLDLRENELHVSPYGRLDLASDRLNAYTESGAGPAALTYSRQNVPTTELAFGVRFDALHQTSFGSVLPHARIEYQHDFEGQSDASVAYADLFGSPGYGVATTTVNHNALVGGVGVDFNLQHGLMFGIDYQALRAVGSENSQMVRFRLSQELDGGVLPSLDLNLIPLGAFTSPVGLRVDASYTYDDNVTRNDGPDKLSDQSYSLNITRPVLIPIIDNVRAIVTPFVGGEKFVEYGGLNHSSYGLNAQLQYRPDGEFGTPILALFDRVTGEEYSSYERTGFKNSVGLSVTKPITDRISLFGALSYDSRHANSGVFDDQDTSARLNVDYLITPRGTVYLSGQYLRGDVVSTGPADLGDFNIASVFVRDDAFNDSLRYAYRFRANTYLVTVGYNYALGETDSLDFSWRTAQSTPLHQANYAGASFIRYFDNQVTVVYLVRF